MLILISGVFVYAVLNGLIGLVVFVSRGYIEPREYDLKEYWTWKGSGRAPWFVRAMRHGRNSNEEEDDHPTGSEHAMNDLSYAERERRDHSSSTTAASTGKDEPPMSPPPDRWGR